MEEVQAHQKEEKETLMENEVDKLELREVSVIRSRPGTIYEEIPYDFIPSIESEIDFSNINQNVEKLKNFQLLKIINCPSIVDILPTIILFVKYFFIPFHSALCLYFRVRGKINELNDLQFHEMLRSFDGYQGSFLIIFESISDNTSWIYWRLKDTKQIFCFNANENFINFGIFVRDFLFKTLKDGYRGIHSSIQFLKNRLKVPVCLEMFSDGRRYDLLFIAAEAGHTELVQCLMKKLNVKKAVKRKAAIDLAFENKHFEIVLLLLKANSRFPNRLKITPEMNLSDDLRIFLLSSFRLHEAIQSKNQEIVEQIINENPGLSFFYDSKNNSALSVAITSKAFKIYELLISKNILLAPHELLDDLFSSLSDSERKKLAQINAKNFQAVSEKHILTLMANVNVGFDDEEHQKRLSLVSDAFQRLNTIEICKLLLQIVAATKNFEINFDFNRDHVQFLDPRAEGYTSGLFYLNGKIFIGAKHLCDESRAHEVLGTIAHEFCHFVMFKIYENVAKPYAKSDPELKEEFKLILTRCDQLKASEEIIKLVYEFYDEDQFAAELIVRYPHILGHYINEPQKVREFEGNFVELVNYFVDKCVPVMRRKLPQIEKESEEKVRREYVKPSSILKKYWKLFLIILLMMASTAALLVLKPCIVKSCGNDSNVFCEVIDGSATCKCSGNSTFNSQSLKCINPCREYFCTSDKDSYCVADGLVAVCMCHKGEFINGTCHQCENNDECDAIQSCVNFKCVDSCKGKCDSHVEAYCLAANHESVCECRKNLIWTNNSCRECLTEENCHQNETCLNNFCFNEENHFLCRDKAAKISLENYCDGIEDCADGTDETCVKGSVFDEKNTITFQTDPKTKITREDFKVFTELNETIDKFSIFMNYYVQFLPINVVECFPNLIQYSAVGCSVRKIKKEHLKGFNELEFLDLRNNKIETVEENSFEDLIELEILIMARNKMNFLSENLFLNSVKLKHIDFSRNFFEKLDAKYFQSLTKLEKLQFDQNFILSLSDKVFDNLTEMKEISLSKNNLEILDENLFKFNNKLENLNFEMNLLKKIDGNLIENLSELKCINFKSNICIDEVYGDCISLLNETMSAKIQNVMNKNCTQ